MRMYLKYLCVCSLILEDILEYVLLSFNSNKYLRKPTPKFGSIILSPGMVRISIFRFCFAKSSKFVFKLYGPNTSLTVSGSFGESPAGIYPLLILS